MIKKIVIAGASTFTVKNLGDEAMLPSCASHKKI